MTDTTHPDDLATRLRTTDRLLRALLDEVESSDDPSFTTAQHDLLERRIYEIRSALADGPDPHDGGRPNLRRADWAGAALEAFARTSGVTDFDDALPDLLTDLMHWCDRHGRSFAGALDTAVGHHRHESGRGPE